MQLFFFPLSSNSRRVLLTAHTLGIRFDERRIDLRSSGDRAALAAVNPNAKVPVLIDRDLVLWESQAIMQYLCEVTPGPTLLPAAPRARADVLRWQYWAASHLAPAVGAICFERLWKRALGGGAGDAEVERRHEAQLSALLAILDAHLADRAWLSGEAVTLADHAIAATLMYSEAARLPVAPFAHVTAWRERVHGLEAWRATEDPSLAPTLAAIAAMPD